MTGKWPSCQVPTATAVRCTSHAQKPHYSASRFSFWASFVWKMSGRLSEFSPCTDIQALFWHQIEGTFLPKRTALERKGKMECKRITIPRIIVCFPVLCHLQLDHSHCFTLSVPPTSNDTDVKAGRKYEDCSLSSPIAFRISCPGPKSWLWLHPPGWILKIRLGTRPIGQIDGQSQASSLDICTFGPQKSLCEICGLHMAKMPHTKDRNWQ